MQKVYYEPTLYRKGGSWFLVICISVRGYDQSWTAGPATLDAETEEEARQEGTRQVIALRKAMEG